ncbi:MAG: hypothetical protein H6597_05455 [Flavobacteriales bacterium]|nr:hypothetical protein [Flavobacteriales bacterium]
MLWWELRRIPYNVVIVVFALLLSIIQGAFFKGGGGGSPLILLLLLLGALLVANIFYTFGWVLDLLFRNSDAPWVLAWRPRLFATIVLITLSAILILKVVEVLHALRHGNLQFAMLN